MKKKYLYVSVLFVMCIGLMIPTNVFAKSTRNFNGYVTVDYRFFVENGKNNENVKNLNFRLYDQTDAFSFQSEYNPNLENYYFIESYRINKSFYQGDIKYIELLISKLLVIFSAHYFSLFLFSLLMFS